MLKIDIAKSEWQEVVPSYKKGGVQYYLLRVNKTEKEGDIIQCVEEIYNHLPTTEDKETLYNNYLTFSKSVTIDNAIKYSQTSDIKVFTIKDGDIESSGWFDDEKRTSIKNSVSVEKAAGRNTTKIFVNGVEFTMDCDKAIELIDSLELYAKDCFVVTETHKASIYSKTEINEVESYDYKKDYPEKVIFVL